MGRRHNARRLGMQLLYQMDLRREQAAMALSLAIESSQSEPETKAVAQALAQGAWQQHETLDAEIKKRSQHWALDRISRLYLAILRMALYEMSLNETPMQIVIDEAVELAKEFSTDESPKFINGILGAPLNSLSQSAA